MTSEDAALWSRSRAGDVDAFAVLFERHARTIYNYCFRRSGEWAAAEDLVSVVFLEAWRRRDKELPDGSVLPWLFGIATNVVRNHRRAQRRYASALGRIPRGLTQPSSPTPMRVLTTSGKSSRSSNFSLSYRSASRTFSHLRLGST